MIPLVVTLVLAATPPAPPPQKLNAEEISRALYFCFRYPEFVAFETCMKDLATRRRRR